MKAALIFLALPTLIAACTPSPASNKFFKCYTATDCPDVIECSQWGDCRIDCLGEGACSGKTIHFSRDHVNLLNCDTSHACVGTKVSLADRPKLGSESCLQPGDTYGANNIICGEDDSCKDLDVTLEGRCAGDHTKFGPNQFTPMSGVAGSVPPSAISGLKCNRCSSAPSWINGCPLPAEKTCGTQTCNCKWADKASCSIHDGTGCNTCCCGRYNGGGGSGGISVGGFTIGWRITAGVGGCVALTIFGIVINIVRRRMRRARGAALALPTPGMTGYVAPTVIISADRKSVV